MDAPNQILNNQRFQIIIGNFKSQNKPRSIFSKLTQKYIFNFKNGGSTQFLYNFNYSDPWAYIKYLMLFYPP